MTVKISGSASIQLINPSDIIWLSKAIGEPFALRDDLEGVPVPPIDNPNYRYIKLTAGDLYNGGILTSELVSGSAPRLTATATISLAGSPLNGRQIHLINTERRVLRAGSSGTLEDDQIVSHNHTGTTSSNGAHNHSVAMVLSQSTGSNFDGAIGTENSFRTLTTSTNGAHTHTFTTSYAGGSETRVRNIGVSYYMRIK